MSYARNLLFPAPPQPAQRKSSRREAGTYTTTDSAVVEYQKRNGTADTRVLTSLAERHNFTRKTPMTVAEIQVETNLGQRAVEKALKVLEAAGFCHQEGRTWRYGKAPANARANSGANARANDRASFISMNAVQYGKFLSLKEVEGSRRKLKDNNIFITGTLWPAQIAPGAAAGCADFQEQEPETGRPEQLAPDGAASGEANSGDKPSLPQEKPVTGKAATVTETSFEKVPPVAPATYGAAQAILTQMGAWAVWADWTRAHRLNNAAQDAQIVQFALWAQDGLLGELALNASEITAAGSYAHPFPALKARMKSAQTCRAAQQRQAEGAGRPGPEAQCQPGERRRDPQTGQVWIVEEVAYGNVIFEEGQAPMNVRDVVVAGWEVLA